MIGESGGGCCVRGGLWKLLSVLVLVLVLMLVLVLV
jgi:hypothetical protein